MTPKTLERALEIFRERGGAKGTLLDGSGRVCVLGACALAQDGWNVTKLRKTLDDSSSGDEVASDVIEYQIYGGTFAKELRPIALELFNVRDAWDVNDVHGPAAAEQLLEKALVRAQEKEGL